MLSRFFPDSLRRRIAEFPARVFVWLGVHPNLVTVFAVLFSLVSVFFILNQQWFFVFVFIVLALAVDAVDGSVARLSGKASLFGNYFDAMMDRFVEAVYLIGFSFVFPLASVLALAGSMIVSYAKPRVGLVIISDNHHWPALGERADRTVLLLFALFLALLFPSGLFGFSFVELGLYLVALISWIGSFQRIVYAKKLIDEAEKQGNVLPYLKKK